MILSSLTSGIQRTRSNLQIVFLYYAASLVSGLIVMVPLRTVLNNVVGQSLLGEKLAGGFDMDFLFEFIVNSKGALDAVTGTMIVAAALYAIFLLFLSGGTFSTFLSMDEYTPSLFWGSAAKYFGRFLRLFLWSIPLFLILYFAQYLEKGIVRMIFGTDPYEYIRYWGGWIRVGLGLIAILLYYMIFDYARIYTVVNDERRMRIAIWSGVRFAFRNFPQTFGLCLLWFIIGIVALCVYVPLADLMHAPKGVVVFVLFLFQQLYIFFRMSVKVALCAGEMNLFITLTPGEVAEGTFPGSGLAPAQAGG